MYTKLDSWNTIYIDIQIRLSTSIYQHLNTSWQESISPRVQTLVRTSTKITNPSYWLLLARNLFLLELVAPPKIHNRHVLHIDKASSAPTPASHMCTREYKMVFHYLLHINHFKQYQGFQMPQNLSLLLSKQLQEQLLPLLPLGFLQTLIFHGKTLALVFFLNLLKNPSAHDKESKSQCRRVHQKETSSLQLSHL